MREGGVEMRIKLCKTCESVAKREGGANGHADRRPPSI